MPLPDFDRACIIIPALDAADTLPDVVRGLRDAIPELADSIFVVDDGSSDATAKVARDLACHVTSHAKNRGKGAALRTGFEEATAKGKTFALTVDADGQHPAEEARKVLLASDDDDVLVLGIRDLVRDGAPRANRFSNGVSNTFISLFAAKRLRDTQCGLRRYPIKKTLKLDVHGTGYELEAEVLMRSVWGGIEIVQVPIHVLYPKNRKTHFKVSRDPWRILGMVLRSTADRHRKKLFAFATVLLLPILLHTIVGLTTRIAPPRIDTPPPSLLEVKHGTNGDRRTSKGWTALRGVRIAYLQGSPEEIGAQHSALLYDLMAQDERVVWDGFAELVPFSPVRTLMFDIGRVQYRDVASGFPDERRRELAAEAKVFAPDPYEDHLPTYQRMVMLHALYDIALSFEKSPLLGGCTAFGFTPEATADGHTLFARAFDFEAADIFDRDKVVFFIHETGKTPFASVAWPGFVGVVTGMNAEGVALAVHGGRAKEPSTSGVPVAFTMREVLSNAKNVDDAVAILSRLQPMVSHIVFVGDASGRFVVVERAPGVPDFVRSTPSFTHPTKPSITNHFEGPLKGDPKDDAVRASTTTLSRRARIDELLATVPPKSATVDTALTFLRDHRCAGDTSCPVGDRRAIDPFIATHGIIADLTTKTLWVSIGPRLSGSFVKVEPALFVQPPDAPIPPADTLEKLPEDAALHDGRYVEGRARAGGPLLHPDRPSRARH